jgi:hypothetical protein
MVLTEMGGQNHPRRSGTTSEPEATKGKSGALHNDGKKTGDQRTSFKISAIPRPNHNCEKVGECL